MGKFLSALLALAAGIVIGSLAGPAPAAAETIKIAHSTWVGYGPLYIARDKGIFKKNGVDVELVRDGGSEGALPDPHGRQDPDDRQHGRYGTALSEEPRRFPIRRRDRRLRTAATASSRNKDITSIKRSQGQEGRRQRGLGLGILPERAARQRRAQGVRPQHRQHDRDGRRHCLRHQAGRCGGHLGAWLTKGKTAPISAICSSTARSRQASSPTSSSSSRAGSRRTRRTSRRSSSHGKRPSRTTRRIPRNRSRSWPRAWAAGSRTRRISRQTLSGIKFYGGDDNKTFFGTAGQARAALPDTPSGCDRDLVEPRQASGQGDAGDLINYSFVNG